MKFIIGKKQEMTQLWKNDKVVAVTLVKAEPNVVVQVKNDATDGYSALQMGFGVRKEKNIKKPQLGHMKGLGSFAKLREFRIEGVEAKKGDKVSVDTFQEGDIIQVTATSKGKGFQGVVKRHGFKGQIKTHGTKDQVRMPGSIGAKGPAHVFKGTRMGGRMGGKQITTSNLEIIKVDSDNNILYIKGAVPGAINGLVMIKGKGDLKFITDAIAVDASASSAQEEVVEEKIVDASTSSAQGVTEEVKVVEVNVDPSVASSSAEAIADKNAMAGEENIEEVVIEAGKKIEDESATADTSADKEITK